MRVSRARTGRRCGELEPNCTSAGQGRHLAACVTHTAARETPPPRAGGGAWPCSPRYSQVPFERHTPEQHCDAVLDVQDWPEARQQVLAAPPQT